MNKIIAQLTLLSLSLILGQYTTPGINPSELKVCAILFSISLIVHFSGRIISSNIKLIEIDTLFTVGYLSVNASIPLLFIFESLSASTLRWASNSEFYFGKAFYYSCAGLCCFYIGFDLINRDLQSPKLKKPVRKLAKSEELATILLMTMSGVFLVVVFLARNGSSYLSGSYNGVLSISGYETLMLQHGRTLISLSATLSVLIIARTRRLSFIPICSIAATVALVIVYMIHGDRSDMIITIIPTVMALYYKRIIQLPTLLFGFSAIVIIMQLMLTYRSGERSMSNILANEIPSLNEAFYTIANNLGQSGNLNGIAISHLENAEHFNGQFFISNIPGLIPFAHSFMVSRFWNANEVTATSSNFLTITLNGNFLSGGVGTSTVAESLLDFGKFGLIYTHLFIGFVAGLVFKYSKNADLQIGHQCIYMFACGVFLTMPRYGAAEVIFKTFLSGFVFYICISTLVRYFFAPTTCSPQIDQHSVSMKHTGL